MPIPPALRMPPRRALVTFTVATRKSPLALVQAELAVAYMQERLAHHAFRVLKLMTTGDRQEEWSLQQEGGKGLFTGELELALRDFRADLAVHSAKDLPTEINAGLAIAGYLPREDARDVLAIREGLARPGSIATGSPRRRLQLQRQFAKATFVEIRGNIDTRLRKVSEGLADATVLAAAGLRRLKINEWPGLRFQVLPLAVCVPAVGQGAIAVQARSETAAALRPNFDPATWMQVELERTFLRMMGGGCHTSFAVHYDGAAVHIFHDLCGYQRFGLPVLEATEPERVAARLIAQLKLNG
jgi:hydroxymethylbilane synthase